MSWFAFMLFIFLVNGGLFALSAYNYSFSPDANWSFLIARGCGLALNFDCAAVVLLMLRKVLSFLRSTWLFHILPFDETIEIHKIFGYLILFLAMTHTLAHVGNALILQTYKNFTAGELLLTHPSILPVGLRVGRLAGSAFITGWILDVVLLVLIVGSLSYVRRSGHFEVFFWTHKICYLMFWFLLILHGPNFWCWFVGPAILLIREKISQMKIVKALRYGKTYVKEINLLPSRVTHLVLTRPRHFKFKAGDYIFIQIPKIAPHEWHPFTISSAPEQIDSVTIHIRSAGNWTKRLYQFFDTMVNDESCKSDAEGKVNQGFELSPMDNGGAGQIKLEEYTVDQTAVSISSDGTDSDDDSFEPPPVLTIRRLSFQPEEELPLGGVTAPFVLNHIAEEGDDDDNVNKTEENVDETEMSTVTIDNDAISTTSADEGPLSSDSPSEVVQAIKTPNDRKLSKQISKPNVTFDLNTKRRIRVHIQGPYGTPSTSIFQSEHAVLIGAGIGVTPYASIVQSIIYRHRSSLNECPNCSHSWVDDGRRQQALRVKKVDFMWMNRNATAFEWFVDMLLRLENEQSHYSLDHFLDIHLFMTGMKRFDMKNIGLQMALDLVHKEEQRDLLTGLRTKLQAGRPDWKTFFQKIKDERKGRVSVFFCGAPALGSVISNHCSEFGFKFRKESF